MWYLKRSQELYLQKRMEEGDNLKGKSSYIKTQKEKKIEFSLYETNVAKTRLNSIERAATSNRERTRRSNFPSFSPSHVSTSTVLLLVH